MYKWKSMADKPVGGQCALWDIEKLNDAVQCKKNSSYGFEFLTQNWSCGRTWRTSRRNHQQPSTTLNGRVIALGPASPGAARPSTDLRSSVCDGTESCGIVSKSLFLRRRRSRATIPSLSHVHQEVRRSIAPTARPCSSEEITPDAESDVFTKAVSAYSERALSAEGLIEITHIPLLNSTNPSFPPLL